MAKIEDLKPGTRIILARTAFTTRKGKAATDTRVLSGNCVGYEVDGEPGEQGTIHADHVDIVPIHTNPQNPKVGDRVRFKNPKEGYSFWAPAGATGTIVGNDGGPHRCWCVLLDEPVSTGSFHIWKNEMTRFGIPYAKRGAWASTSEIEVIPAAPPAPAKEWIVALVDKRGRLRPAPVPFPHKSEKAALTEAERLSRLHGKPFVVLSTIARVTVPPAPAAEVVRL